MIINTLEQNKIISRFEQAFKLRYELNDDIWNQNSEVMQIINQQLGNTDKAIFAKNNLFLFIISNLILMFYIQMHFENMILILEDYTKNYQNRRIIMIYY